MTVACLAVSGAAVDRALWCHWRRLGLAVGAPRLGAQLQERPEPARGDPGRAGRGPTTAVQRRRRAQAA